MSINPEHLKDFPMSDRAVATGEYDSYIWVTAKAPMYGINGYVRIPDDELANHPWELAHGYIFEPDESDIGWCEITFHDGNWFGFDTLHSFNYWPEEYIWAENKKTFMKTMDMLRDERSITMTPECVEHMTQGFAKQASEAYLHTTAVGTHQI